MLPLLLACFVTQDDWDQQSDRDGDGYIAWQLGGQDCNDDNAAIHPAAEESCLDDVDSDCDGELCPLTSQRTPSEWAVGLYLWEPLLGDFDGDGADEIVISELTPNPQDELVAVQLELPLSPTFSMRDDPEGIVATSLENEGLWVFDAGDLDGDGDPDLAISSRGGSARTAFVDTLSRTPMAFDDLPQAINVKDSTADEPIVGMESAVFYGRVQPLGDPDGDGRDALLLAAPTVGADQGLNGVVWLIEGFPDGEQPAAEAAMASFSGEAGELLGFAVGASDLDDDGFQDPILSGPGWSPGSAGAGSAHGQISVFTSRSPGPKSSEDADAWVRGDYANARVGSGYGIGDVNGDGHQDMACHLGAGNGQLLVYWGPMEGHYGPQDAPLRLSGDETITHDFGLRARAAGDLDDDGSDEILISAPTEGLGDETPLNAGAVYLFYGPLEGVASPEHAAVRWVSPEDATNLGTALLTDLDGDGTVDGLFGSEPLFGRGSGTLWLDTDVLADVDR